MADNVRGGSTDGTLPLIATDERSISGTAVQVPRGVAIGGSTFTSGQTTVSNAGTAIVSASETRLSLTLVNHQTVDVYVGGSAVSSTTGVRVPPEAALTLPATGAVYGITAAAYTPSGDAKVHWIEVTAP